MIIDPTRTKMLRLQYMRQLTKQFKVFQKHVVPSILAIIDNYNNNFTFNRGLRKKTLRVTGFNQDIDSYLNWAIENDIISPSHEIVRRNINQAYSKGVKNATKQLRLTYDYGVGDKLTMLDYEAMMELRDINFDLIKASTDAMRHNIQYNTTQGVLNGWGMERIAQNIRKGVRGNSGMGIVRARMIARTEVINAYNVGAKKRYEQAGIKERDMVWITAFDERTCFPASVKIKTNNGEKKISKIKKGDLVLTRDGYKPVMETLKRKYNGKLINIEADKYSLCCTENHPLFIVGKGWLPANRININDCLQTFNDESIEISSFINFPLSKSDNSPAIFIKKPVFSSIPLNILMPVNTINFNSNLCSSYNKINGITPDLNFLFERDTQSGESNSNFLFNGCFSSEFPITGERAESSIFISRDGSKCFPAVFTFNNNWWSSTQFGAINNIFSPTVSCKKFSTSFTSNIPSISQSAFNTTNDISIDHASGNFKMFTTDRAGFFNLVSLYKCFIAFFRAICSIPIAVGKVKRFITNRAFFNNQLQHLTIFDRINQYLYGSISIYNLRVRDKPEYYANGILVHNCEICAGYDGMNIKQTGEIPPAHPNCFISHSIKIHTDEGIKTINNIKIGDKVLTHKGRFKPVTKVLDSKDRFHGDVIQIRYKGKDWGDTLGNRRNSLTITPEHPFLTQRGWVKADDLDLFDSLYVIAHECEQCGKLIPFWLRYCNNKCRNNTDEHKQKMSKCKLGDKNPMWDNEPWNYKGGKLWYYGKDWKNIRKQVIARDNGICQQCGMTFEDSDKEFGQPLQVHHINPYRASHSHDLDNLITLCCRCHTIVENTTNKEYLKSGGVLFTLVQIKDLRRIRDFEGEKLYNFSVEEDESYIANGVVNHNCRCSIAPYVK